MTQYGIKNKGNLAFNYKLNKCIHLSKTPMKGPFNTLKKSKIDLLKIIKMSKKKSFLYYSCVSVSEGLSTEYKISELCLERFDKKLNKKCRNCQQVF